jgi:iron complex transport system substrate-binding protein
MIKLWKWAALWGVMASGAAQGQPVSQVASINLCTDQLLVALAPAERIVALSAYARDQRMSGVAAEAARLPVITGGTEAMLMLRPDLIVADSFTSPALIAFLRGRGTRIELFNAPQSLGDVRTLWRQMGAALGRPTEAEQQIVLLDDALARLKQSTSARPISVLPLARRGWSEGRATLLGDILTQAGLRHTGADAGGFMDLERVVQARPDALLVLGGVRSGEDQGAAMLDHPALKVLFPAERRMSFAESLTVCAGPALPGAIDRLREGLASIAPR